MKHKILREGGFWWLRIWEKAHETKDRPAPYLYKIQLRFQSEEEAIAHLEQCYPEATKPVSQPTDYEVLEPYAA